MLQTNVSTYETTGIYDDQLIDQKYRNILTNNLTVEQKTTYMVSIINFEHFIMPYEFRRMEFLY